MALIFVGALLVAVAIAWSGFRHVPIGHKGVLLALGRRTARVLGEGWHWVIPVSALRDVAVLDCRETTLPTLSEDTWTSDRVRVRFNVSAQYRVADPAKYLDLGENVVEGKREGIVPLFQQAIRRAITSHTSRDVLAGGTVDRRETIESFLEQDLRPTATTRWGLELLDIFVTDLDVDDAQLRSALSATATAHLLGEARVTDAQYDVNRITLLTSAAQQLSGQMANAAGRPISPEEAFQFLQRTYASVRDLDIRQILAQQSQLVAMFSAELRGASSGRNGGS